MQKVALNRDWFGRDSPNTNPTYGFYPVWPVLLIRISGFNKISRLQYFPYFP